MDITSIGELLIDLTSAGVNGNGVALYAANPGGAPANVAAAAARLGAHAAFIGRVGDDYFGRSAADCLRRCGVDTRGVAYDPSAPTTLAVVSLDERGERSFQFYRSMGADIRLSRGDIPEDLVKSSSVLHFGSLSLTHESCREALMYALELAESCGVIRSYDANYRANLWPDEVSAVAQMRSLLPHADIVKLSAEELQLLSGSGGDVESAARSILDFGCSLLFVTQGKDGARWFTPLAEGRAFSPAVEAADTNGAGDSFMGAALTKLCHVPRARLAGLDAGFLNGVTDYACRAAALTCTRSGTIPALPDASELGG